MEASTLPELQNLSHTNSKYFVPKVVGPVLKEVEK